MEFHWYNAIPWLIALIGTSWGILKDNKKDRQDTENRLRALELKGITDNLEHQHQLELMKLQLAAATTAAQHTQTLITAALKNAN